MSLIVDVQTIRFEGNIHSFLSQEYDGKVVDLISGTETFEISILRPSGTIRLLSFNKTKYLQEYRIIESKMAIVRKNPEFWYTLVINQNSDGVWVKTNRLIRDKDLVGIYFQPTVPPFNRVSKISFKEPSEYIVLEQSLS